MVTVTMATVTIVTVTKATVTIVTVAMDTKDSQGILKFCAIYQAEVYSIAVNFRGFNFRIQHRLLTTLLYRRRDNGDERGPVREGRTSSAGLNRYSTIVRSTETRAQNTRIKISMCSKVHAKVCENLDLTRISCYTVYIYCQV